MKTHRYPHLLSAMFNRPFLATPELMFEAVLFAQTHLGLALAEEPGATPRMVATQPARLGAWTDDDSDAGNEPDGDDDDGTGVAQIHISGPLVPRTGDLKMCQDMTAYETIDRQLQAALNNPAISRIMLDVASNGGDARGGFETAERIRAANLIKPVHAVVHFNGYSGGYLLASAAGEISVSQSSGVGSIGVIMKAMNVTEALKQQGVVVETFYRGDRKNDLAPDSPVSDGARAAIEARLDEIYTQFVGAVATYRNLPVQKVIATQAGLFYGQGALDAGLADRLETPQQAFDRIVGLAAADKTSRLAPRTGGQQTTVSAHAQRMRLAQAMDMSVAMEQQHCSVQ